MDSILPANVEYYLHSRLIRDTGVIFLNPKNYGILGYLANQESDIASNAGKLSISTAVGSLSVASILTFFGSYDQSTQNNNPFEKQNPSMFISSSTLGSLDRIVSLQESPLGEASDKDIPPDYEQMLLRDRELFGILPNKTPEEVAYENKFAAFLKSHLTKNGYSNSKLQELVRTEQMTTDFFGVFRITADGTPRLVDEAYSFPEESSWVDFGNTIEAYYHPLFESLPRFTSPFGAGLREQHVVTLGIKNTGEFGVYALPCYILTRFCFER